MRRKITRKGKQTIMNREMIIVRNKLFKSFKKAKINSIGEFIANPATNSYFNLKDCQTERDVQKKIIHWLSRDCEKAIIHTKHKKYLRYSVNEFLNTNFSRADFRAIYTLLGNGVDEKLTNLFIDSNFDMDLLRKTYLEGEI